MFSVNLSNFVLYNYKSNIGDKDGMKKEVKKKLMTEENINVRAFLNFQ